MFLLPIVKQQVQKSLTIEREAFEGDEETGETPNTVRNKRNLVGNDQRINDYLKYIKKKLELLKSNWIESTHPFLCKDMHIL